MDGWLAVVNLYSYFKDTLMDYFFVGNENFMQSNNVDKCLFCQTICWKFATVSNKADSTLFTLYYIF